MGRVSKRRFSIGEALNAPFGLLKRRPVTVFIWGLLRFALVVGVVAAMTPFFMHVLASAQAEVEPDIRQIMGMEAGVQGLNLLSLLVSLIVFTAAIRATWAKRGDGLAFLRIGMDEVRVAVTSIAVGVGVYLGVIVLVLAGLALAAAISPQGEQVVIPVMVAYGGLAALLTIWVLARVILIIPVSVLDRTFAFERGWALGRGQAAKLAVTGFLAWIIQILIQLVFLAVAAGVMLMVAHSAGVVWPDFSETPPTLAQLIELARPFALPAAILAVPAILLTGFSGALFSAPLASAARQLSDSGTPPRSPAVAADDDGLSPIVSAAAAAAIAADPADAHAPSATPEADHNDPPGEHPAEAHHEAEHHEVGHVDEPSHAASADYGHEHQDESGHAGVEPHGHDHGEAHAASHDAPVDDDQGHPREGDGQ